MKIHKRNYLPTIFIVGSFLAMIIIGQKIPKETIMAVMQKAGPFGVILLIFCLWVTNIIAPLSGSPFLFAGFYLYGQMSVFYAFIAAVIASVTNFWVARKWGRKVVVKLAGEESLEKLDGLTKDYGLQTLFIFRLFMKEFHDVISYAFGLTSLTFKQYFIVSTLGMIPATLVWYLISLKVRDPLTFTVVSWLFAYVSLSGYILFRKFSKKKIER